MSLQLVNVATGEVLDTITLTDDDELAYDTGAAQDVIASHMRRNSWTAQMAYRVLGDGWSNGYLRIALDRGEAAG